MSDEVQESQIPEDPEVKELLGHKATAINLLRLAEAKEIQRAQLSDLVDADTEARFSEAFQLVIRKYPNVLMVTKIDGADCFTESTHRMVILAYREAFMKQQSRKWTRVTREEKE